MSRYFIKPKEIKFDEGRYPSGPYSIKGPALDFGLFDEEDYKSAEENPKDIRNMDKDISRKL